MRFFFVFAIASIILLLFYPSTNAKPFLDKKFEQKFDNKRVWNNITQQMEGNGQQHVVVHKRSIDDNVMPVTEKMIDSQGDYVTDKLGEDITENGTKSKRDV
uniref:Uncharacterized protein n=1 Tax=Panagrolaimus superbus TaxID=310955 RepID=A0A914YSJ5_9BILA